MFLVAKLQNIHFPRYWKIRINKCLKSYFCIPTYIQNVDSYVCEDSLQRHQAVPVLLQGRGGQVVLQRDQPGEGNRRSAAGHRKDNVLVTCDLSSAGSRSPPSWPSPGSAAAESRRLSGSGILPMKVGRIQSRCEARPWAAAVSWALIIIIINRASNEGPHGPSTGWKRLLLALSHLRHY